MILNESLTRLRGRFAESNASKSLDFAICYVPMDGLLPVELHVLETCGAGFELDRINGSEYVLLSQGPNLINPLGNPRELVTQARKEALAHPGKVIWVELPYSRR